MRSPDNFYRTYDPNTGRYLEADPMGQAGGINVYQYASARPTMETDRYGRITDSISATCRHRPQMCAALGLGTAGYGVAAATKTRELLAQQGQTCPPSPDVEEEEDEPEPPGLTPEEIKELISGPRPESLVETLAEPPAPPLPPIDPEDPDLAGASIRLKIAFVISRIAQLITGN